MADLNYSKISESQYIYIVFSEYEDKERRARRRSLGNIRFIGELYNLRMLTDRIMHEIIRKLINQTDEESLECLCWLLNTTGKQLEAATEQKLTEAQVIILFILLK